VVRRSIGQNHVCDAFLRIQLKNGHSHMKVRPHTLVRGHISSFGASSSLSLNYAFTASRVQHKLCQGTDPDINDVVNTHLESLMHCEYQDIVSAIDVKRFMKCWNRET
jgi:hypothetical protein